MRMTIENWRRAGWERWGDGRWATGDEMAELETGQTMAQRLVSIRTSGRTALGQWCRYLQPTMLCTAHAPCSMFQVLCCCMLHVSVLVRYRAGPTAVARSWPPARPRPSLPASLHRGGYWVLLGVSGFLSFLGSVGCVVAGKPREKHR